MVLAIFGPTGVGKTGVAVELAKIVPDPVAINCDALQVYEGLDVLTGAATAEEREVLPHELLGFVPISADFSIHEYMPLAHQAIDVALAEGKTPIVVGGTGLYLRAALADLSLRKVPAFDETSELWSGETRHPTRLFGLEMDRAKLYERVASATAQARNVPEHATARGCGQASCQGTYGCGRRGQRQRGPRRRTGFIPLEVRIGCRSWM